MKARVGDLLVVEAPRDDKHCREGVVVAVQGADGAPPYRVRWLEDGREALVYPGPDAHIEAGGERAEQKTWPESGAGEEANPMHVTKRWNIDVLVSEEAEGDSVHTVAEAGLVAKEWSNLRGHGVARKHPADVDVPEIGDELAVSRALSDLAQKLRQAAAEDISEHMGAPWQPS